MRSCLYEGLVQHHRRSPVEHWFRYRVALVYLDLAELDTVFRRHWLWSSSRPAPFRFARHDHFGPPHESLDASVRRFVAEQAGVRPQGPIGLLTQVRHFGYVFDPVSFYYCYGAAGQVEWIVAEVNNTPWGERHCYLLGRDDFVSESSRDVEKRFHVSPFIPMDVVYRWRASEPGQRLSIDIDDIRLGDRFFDVALRLERRPISGANLARFAVRHLLQPQRIITAIYWEALSLWLKGCPFVPHPNSTPTPKAPLETVR